MQNTQEAISTQVTEQDRVTASTEDGSDSNATMHAVPHLPHPAYLATSQLPSRLDASTTTRKLLILDLNGTLLLRPKPRPTRNKTNRRPVHPRPYMPALRSFLFHDAVKPWLDVRVWSSAQPHSVRDMVAHCFADNQHDLQAVWARDTLGLTPEDYLRKVETMKDLEKQWSYNPNGPQHSAKTTLLLDDSPLKARLQPYNHVCIPEYTVTLRNKDLLAKANKLPNQSPGRADAVAQSNNTSSPKFDQTLLAVMGVLDGVRQQTNVAGWIHAGGLWAGRQPSLPEEPSNEPSTPPGNDWDEEAPIWFEHEPCFQYWVDRGVGVAEALGIKLEHGLVR